MGIGFQVAPGAHLRTTTGGPRIGLGPAIVRVDQPPAPASPASDRWSALAGGGRAPTSDPPKRSLLARTFTRRTPDEWASVRHYLDGLLSAHTMPVVRSIRPAVTERRPASQREADAWWERLLANDPATVTGHLDRALAEHRLPAALTAVEDERVHVAVPALTVEKLIGPREPTPSPDGGTSLRRIDKARRHALYESALGSALLGVAATVFATAPGCGRVALAVVVPGHLGGPAVVMLVELPRALVLPDGADRSVTTDLMAAAEAGEVELVRDKGGRLGALRPIDDDPDVRTLLDALVLA